MWNRTSMGSNSDELEFDPPEGLDLQGDKGKAQVTWERMPNGKICITSIDGVRLDGAQSESSDDSTGGESDESGTGNY